MQHPAPQVRQQMCTSAVLHFDTGSGSVNISLWLYIAPTDSGAVAVQPGAAAVPPAQSALPGVLEVLQPHQAILRRPVELRTKLCDTKACRNRWLRAACEERRGKPVTARLGGLMVQAQTVSRCFASTRHVDTHSCRHTQKLLPSVALGSENATQGPHNVYVQPVVQ